MTWPAWEQFIKSTLSTVIISGPLLGYLFIISFIQIWWSRRQITIFTSKKKYSLKSSMVKVSGNKGVIRQFSPVGKFKQGIAIISVFLEIAQLCAIAFSKYVPWTANEYFISLPKIMSSFILTFGEGSFKYVFWVAVGLVFFGYFIVDLCIQHAAKCVGQVQEYTKTELYSTWYRTFVVVVYAKLFDAIGCLDPSSSANTVITIHTEVGCWKDIKLAMLVVSAITLIAYDMVIFSILHNNKKLSQNNKNCIYYDSMFLAFDTRIKIILVFIAIFYEDFPYIVVCVDTVANSILLSLQIVFRPCNYEKVNIIRLCGLCFVVWSSLSGIITIILNQPKSWIPFSVFIGGNILLLPLSIWFYRFTSNKFQKANPDLGRVRLIDPEAVQDNYQTYSNYVQGKYIVN